jgi:hypothetical protein
MAVKVAAIFQENKTTSRAAFNLVILCAVTVWWKENKPSGFASQHQQNSETWTDTNFFNKFNPSP